MNRSKSNEPEKYRVGPFDDTNSEDEHEDHRQGIRDSWTIKHNEPNKVVLISKQDV